MLDKKDKKPDLLDRDLDRHYKLIMSCFPENFQSSLLVLTGSMAVKVISET